MFRKCSILLSITSRAMSKKFKSESLKKAVPGHTELVSNLNEAKNNCTGCVSDNEITTEDSIWKFERFPQIPAKSPNDKKEYSVIRLENGLTALLISDEFSCSGIVSDFGNEDKTHLIEGEESGSESENSNDDRGSLNGSEDGTKKEEKLAACSLTVGGAGSFSDPHEVPGLAHFIEHMIFMGSKKYPEENFFDSYIKKLGGSDNATTECESTTYYFECPDENLSKAMDVFSNLFVSPLMTASAMMREREAVESEFIQNMPNDHYRRQQILMSTAVPENPAGKFVWGNLKTLKDNVTDTFLYEATHSFWKTYYSSDKMTLAVQARLPLDTLEKMVTKHFSRIPHHSIEPVKISLPNTPFDSQKFNKLYYVESIKDKNLLELSWVMPPIKHLFKSKPTNYIAGLVGHEGKGSLMNYLRKRLWAVGLSAGHDDDDLASNDIYSMFVISIAVTDLGSRNIEAILQAVFSYISMLREQGPQERIFREAQQICDLNFRFEEESPAAEYVEVLSCNMQDFPIPHYINGSELLFDYHPDKIKELLEYLSPSSVNIMLARKHFHPSIDLNEVEPWFTTNYTVTDIPKAWTNSWMNIKPSPEFHLPEPNKFIASNFALLNENNEGMKYPEKIFSTETLSIWYKPDTKFKLPTGFIGFHFVNKDTFESVKQNTLLQTYTELLNHFLIEELYPSTQALLEYKIVESEGSLLVEVYGFNEKLYILLEKIAEYINEFNERMTEELLEMHKETKRKEYYNNNFKISNLSREVRLNITLEKHFSSLEKYNVVSQIDMESIKKLSENFFMNTQVQCLVQGNILRDDALLVCNNFINKVRSSCQLPVEKPLYRVHKLLNTNQIIKIKSFDATDANCVTINYYQFGTGSVHEYCIIDLLMLLMEEPLFDQLRTQEQLGYDVSCSIREIYGVLGFTITIVSQIDKQSVEHVEERITDFLKKFFETLKKMPLPEFNQVVKSLIALKQCCDLHLKEEVSRNWAEIKCFEYAFDRLETEQKVLAKLTPEDVINFLEQSIDETNINFRKLTVQIEGNQNNSSNVIDNEIEIDEVKQDVSETTLLPRTLEYSIVTDTKNSSKKHIIKSINQFKSDLDFYPPNKIFHT